MNLKAGKQFHVGILPSPVASSKYRSYQAWYHVGFITVHMGEE